MPKVNSEMRAQWRKAPSREVDLILRVEGPLLERAQALEKQGIEVRRRLRLTSSLAIRCTGHTALKLARRPWITRIAPDSPLRIIG